MKRLSANGVKIGISAWFSLSFLLMLAWPAFGQTPCSPLPDVGACGANGGSNCPNLHGFVPFPGTNAWNVNISSAPIDPQSVTIVGASSFTGQHLHHDFGTSFGYPIEVVDSSQTPATTVVQLQMYAAQSDNVIAPIPMTVPIEGNPTPGTGCPATYQGDAHTHTLDRHTCTIYSTYNTHVCGTAPNQFITADQMTAWDAHNYESRPYGWTSEDASGSSMYAGIVKYDEIAACAAGGPVPPHAIRFTMPDTKNDANGGFFVSPATHAAGNLWGSYNVMGMKIRLQSSFDLSGYSPMNKCILEEMQQYGMILADNGGAFYFQGEPDARWNDTDLQALDSIQSSNFDVLAMTPAWPGNDSATAPTGAPPTVNSFTASALSVSSGSPVTLTYSASGDSYDFIDFAGVGTSGSGSVTVKPTVTTTYTLNSTNQYGRTTSTPITITVPGSTIGTPLFTPAAGTYASAQTVSITTSTPAATIYYTTDGSTPTTHSTVYAGPIQVSVTQTIKAFATAAGYSNPSETVSAAYNIGNSAAATPTFSPAAGTYTAAQTVTISTSTPSATIYYTTDGSTPTTGSSVYSGPITVAATETVQAIAVASGSSNSAVGSAAYTVGMLKTMLAAALAPALVNHVATGTGTTAAVNMIGANFIGVCENTQYGGPTVPTDSNGNTYTLAAQKLGGGNPSTYLYVTYAPTVTSNMTFSDGAGGWPIAVLGFSGVASGPDQTAGALGGPPTLSTGSITPTNANELVLSCIGGQNSGASMTASSSPLTLGDTANSTSVPGYAFVGSAYQIQSSASAATANTWTNNIGNGAAALIASFYSALSPTALATTSANLPEGFVGVPYTSTGSLYSNQLGASGGVAPYTWTVAGGTLPTGLSLGSGGLLTGTPSVAVSARSITFKVTDAQSNTATVTLPITVAATPITVGPGTCTGAALNGTQYTVFGGCALSATGGTPPASFSYSTARYNYAPPEGLTLNPSTGAISGTVYGAGDYPVTFTESDSLGSYATQTITFAIAGNYVKNGWDFFPQDSVFHLNVSSLPVDTSVAAPMLAAYLGRGIAVLTDVSTGGIPWAHWPSSQANSTVTTIWPGYGVGADFPPYSLPTPSFATSTSNPVQSAPISPYATIEATQNNSNASNYIGDGHSLSVILPGGGNPAYLYEMYNAQYSGGQWYNASDAWWNLTGYQMPIQDQGEATDAAGLPVAPFLITYDEAVSGTINHAARFTLQGTLNYHVWPATAQAGGGKCTGGYEDYNNLILQPGSPGGSAPTGGCSGGPEGEIYRLKTSVSTSSVCAGNPIAQNIIAGFRNYGIILADNGGTGYVIAAADSRWPDLSCLNSIKLGDFEPVNVSSVIKTLDSNNLPTVSYQTTVGAPVAAATPTLSPASGSYTSSQTVTIGTATPSATIYYTTDGSTPTTNSPTYTSPITVTTSETVQAIAIITGSSASQVGSAAYTITPQATTPSFSPAAGTYTSTQSVSISSSTPSATIYYTTNGTTPTTGSSVYAGPISVAASETLQAIAIASGGSASQVGSAAYTITPQATTPSFSPAAGTYTSTQSVSISSSTPSATIYYTTNGTTPTTGSSVYAGPISVAASETLQAIAIASGGSASTVGSAAYTITPPATTPYFSPAAGTYTSTQSVSISSSTPFATIYYTTNGTTPTTSSPTYTGPISIAATETVKAIAIASGGSASAVGSAAYSITPPATTPSFSPAAGTYTSTQSVSISSSTPSATIYYTTNGTTPTTSSPAYTGPISIAATETVKAIAIASGGSASTVGSAAYTITPQATTPSFSPAAGTYTSTQSVSISSSTPSATIYYTTNGSAPTTSSAVYAGPISVAASETLQAIAIASGGSASTVGSAAYTITPPMAMPTFSVASGTYTTPQTVNITPPVPSATVYYTTNGATPTTSSSVCSGPIMVATTETLKAVAVASGYSPSGVNSANYTIAAPSVTTAFSPAAGTYTSTQTVSIITTAPSATIYYTTDGSKPTTKSPVYSYPIMIDATETVNAITVVNGQSVDGEASATYTINLPPVGAPTFSPAAGSYTSPQLVTISTTMPSAIIYYTTNGRTPTTSSPIYSGPIMVSATETIQAIAVSLNVVSSKPVGRNSTSRSSSPLGSALYIMNSRSGSFRVSLSPSSITVTPGQSSMAAVLVTPLNGYSAAISFSCAGLPSGASCQFSPGSVTPAGGVATTTLTVVTSAENSAPSPGSSTSLPGSAMALALCCLGWKRRHAARLLMLAAAAAIGMGLCTGCGTNVPFASPTTSTVTLVATDGAQQPTTSFTLTVQ